MRYNIYFDIAAACFLIVSFAYQKIQFGGSQKRNRIFRRAIIVALAADAMDILTAFTISYAHAVPDMTNQLLNSLYYALLVTLIHTTTDYVGTYISDGTYKRRTKLTNTVVLVAYYLLLMINIPAGMLFRFEGGEYIHGALFPASYIIGVYYILFTFVFVISNKRAFTQKQFISLLAYEVIALLSMALQYFVFENTLLVNLGVAVSIMVLMLSLETPDYRQMFAEVTEALAGTIDAKDSYTNNHSSRVAKYSVMLGKQMGKTEDELEDLYYIGLLHDIGKIGIPDEIINKPGKLTEKEYEIIKNHSVIGSGILGKIISMPELVVGARWHHEWYNGCGYPDGCRGSDIPEVARIISMADAYDAMTSRRSYRSVLTQSEVISEIENGKGTQFDPVCAEKMLELIRQDPEYKMRETPGAYLA